MTDLEKFLDCIFKCDNIIKNEKYIFMVVNCFLYKIKVITGFEIKFTKKDDNYFCFLLGVFGIPFIKKKNTIIVGETNIYLIKLKLSNKILFDELIMSQFNDTIFKDPDIRKLPENSDKIIKGVINVKNIEILRLFFHKKLLKYNFNFNFINQPVINPLSLITKIVGPVSIYEYYIYFKGEFPVKIYLFGDEHVKKSLCVNNDKNNMLHLDEYMKILSKEYPSKFVDYFLEIDTQQRENLIDKSQKINNTSYIHDLYFSLEKQSKINKNFRKHLTDIRPELLQILVDLRDELISVIKMNISNSDKYLFFKTFVLSLNWNIDSHLLDFKLIYVRILKQFKNSRLSTRIIDHLIKNLNLLCKEIENNYISKLNSIKHQYIDALNPNYLDTKNGELVSEIIQKSESFLDIYTLITDYYTFGRMFKKYDITRNFSHPEFATNIIVYFGDAHINNIRNLLNLVPSTNEVSFSISDKNGINYQCLNISNFQRPFFIKEND